MRLFRLFQKTGQLITADGSDDNLIQPEGTENYSLIGPIEVPPADAAVIEPAGAVAAEAADADGDAPMAAAAPGDGKEAKADPVPKADAKAAADAEEDDQEEDEGQYFESDDEPDSDADLTALHEALPENFSTVDKQPALDANLVGKYVLFLWKSVGWQCALVVEHFSPPLDKEKFNYLLEYEGEDTVKHCLSLANYRFDDAAPVGSWCALAPNVYM